MTKAFPVLIPLEKGRTYHSASQAGMDFDGESHPREAKGTHDDKYKPGEFIPKEKAPEVEPQHPNHVWNDTRTRLEQDLKQTAATAAELVKDREEFRRGEYEAAYKHNQEVSGRNSRIKFGKRNPRTGEGEGGRSLTPAEEKEQDEARKRLDRAFEFIRSRENLPEEKAIPGLEAALFAHLLTNPLGWEKTTHLKLDHDFSGREVSFPAGTDLGFISYGTDPKKGSMLTALAAHNGETRRIRVPLDWVKPAEPGSNPFRVCSRCHGTGEYSYNQQDGTRCYGCGGSGVQVKKSAVKTSAAYRKEAMTKAFPVLTPLEKGRTYHSDAQVGLDFDEDSHPRAPKGAPHGGEFVKKDEVEKFPVQYRRHGHPTPETRLVTVPPNADPERKPPAPVGGEIIEARGRKEADRINAALYNAYGYHAKIVHQHGGYILKDTGLDAETAHDLMFLLGSSIASKKVTQELIEGTRAQRVAQAAENARRYDEMLAAREANAGRFAHKKEVPAGPIHHDTYTGPRHTYGLTNRPAGYSHIPEGWVVGSEKEHPDYRHGTVDYPRPLTEQEQRSYELETVHPHEEGGLSVKDMRHARAFAEDMARDGWTGQEKADLDALQTAIDAGPRALADFLQATQDTNDFSYTLAGNVTLKKAFPVLKIAPLPEDTALLSERSELGDSQGGPPPAKPFLIPHSKRPRRRVPNRQGGGGKVLNEEETERTNLVLDPPVLVPFEGTLLVKDLGL